MKKDVESVRSDGERREYLVNYTKLEDSKTLTVLLQRILLSRIPTNQYKFKFQIGPIEKNRAKPSLAPPYQINVLFTPLMNKEDCSSLKPPYDVLILNVTG